MKELVARWLVLGPSQVASEGKNLLDEIIARINNPQQHNLKRLIDRICVFRQGRYVFNPCIRASR